MDEKDYCRRVAELEEMLEISERKSDILTSLLKEASAEYEQALEKISISEMNFRTVFENAPEAIYIIDAETHRILDCNSFTLSWLGYSRDELLSMRVEDILAPGATGIMKNIRKAMTDGFVHVHDRRYLKKDMTPADAEVSGAVVNFKGKKSFLALVRDITQRKQVEELSRYKELFSNVTDPVFINNPKGRFLEVNDIACNRFCYSREQMLRMSVRDIIKSDNYDMIGQIGENFGKSEAVQFEIETVSGDGEVIPFEFHSKPIKFKGVSAILSVCRDLSFRKKMEEALVKSERLSAVGEMASGVAHNFNNLLQVIAASGEASLSKLLSGNVRETEEALRDILKAAEIGADIVRRINDFTLTHAGYGDPDAVFFLGDVMEEAVRFTRPLWKDRPDSQKYGINYIKAPGCFIKGKPSQIHEVLVNLIKNGLESMPDGGVLTVSTHISNHQAHLIVSDQGQGISEENLQRIFEPFFSTKGQKNSGLGLASAYGIVKKHRGKIDVRSRLGQGAAFTIALPLEHSKIETQPRSLIPVRSETTDVVSGRPLQKNCFIRLLVIDDEINILKAMKLCFEGSGIELITADTAIKGVKIAEEKNMDVILCDIGMDDMNGWEVGKRIKALCRKRRIPKIPFLLYTGMIIKQFDHALLEECGIDRVVKKPVSYDQLQRIICEAAAGSVSCD